MNFASKDIATYLQQLSNGSSNPLVVGSNLFVNQEPTSPDNCVTIIDIPSWPPDLNLDGSSSFVYSTIQIQIRNLTDEGGKTFGEQIVNLLQGKNNFTVNGTLYHACICIAEFALLDWDEKNRARYTSTFEIQRRRS